MRSVGRRNWEVAIGSNLRRWTSLDRDAPDGRSIDVFSAGVEEEAAVLRPGWKAVSSSGGCDLAKISSRSVIDINIRFTVDTRIEDNAFAVGRPGRGTCEGTKMSNLLEVVSLRIRDPDLVRAAAIRFEGDLRPIGRDVRIVLDSRGGNEHLLGRLGG